MRTESTKIKTEGARVIRHIIGQLRARARFRSGEIRILDSSGTVERTILFSEADRKL